MLDPKAWINLEKVSVLIADSNSTSLQIMRQVLAGFGVRRPLTCATADEGLELASEHEINLVVANDVLGDTTGYEFIRALRRRSSDHNAFAPVIMISGHTKRANVAAARDCGANFVVAKPISPQVMLERIVWVAKEGRPFVEAGAYLGPDRRFHEGEGDKPRRRRGDPQTAVYDPASPSPRVADEEIPDIKGAA